MERQNGYVIICLFVLTYTRVHRVTKKKDEKNENNYRTIYEHLLQINVSSFRRI